MNQPVLWHRVIVFMIIIAVILTVNSAFAGWEVYTPPRFTGSPGINVVNGDRQASGATIVIQKGEKIKLSANTIDEDIDREIESPDVYGYDGPAEVIWTKSGGGILKEGRTQCGVENEFTAPNQIGNITITAQADDHPYHANDGAGESTTLNIRVINGCPNDINISSTCTTLPDWSTFKTFGYLVTKMCVSGGTPPNPPNNWNGLQVTETVGVNSTGTTCTDAKLNGITVASACTGNGTFTVGLGCDTTLDCLCPQANNCFYDSHLSIDKYEVRLKSGESSCDIVCSQEYFCNGTSLGKFNIRKTFELISVTPPTPSVERCKVTVTKTKQ
jgi:hypothetical protein